MFDGRPARRIDGGQREMLGRGGSGKMGLAKTRSDGGASARLLRRLGQESWAEYRSNSDAADVSFGSDGREHRHIRGG